MEHSIAVVVEDDVLQRELVATLLEEAKCTSSYAKVQRKHC